MKRRAKSMQVSVATRLRGIAALQVVICALLFIYLAIDRPYDAYREYLQDTTQASALFSTLSAGHMENTLESTKYAGQLLNNGSEQTFIAEALKQGGIQNNYAFCRQLYTYAKSLTEQQSQLSHAAVFELDGSGVYTGSKSANYYLTKSAENAPWLSKVTAARGGAVIFTPEERAGAGLPPLFDDRIVIARAVFNPFKLESEGVYALSIACDTFDALFSTYRVLPAQEYALTYQGKPLFAPFDAGLESIGSLPLRELVTKPIFHGNSLWLYSYYRFEHNSVLTIRAPFSAVVTIFKINFLLLASIFVVLCLFVMIIRSLINGILLPLRHLTSALDATTDSFFPTLTETHLPQDLEPLFHAYNRMSSRIDLLVNEGLRKDIAARELELQLLRTQINPHYLYNTLECIHMRAYINHDYEVAHMAELLGRNLQYGLRATNAKVPLYVEFEKAGEYMTLVGNHYGDRVRFISHLDDSIRDCMVVKLLLQPLIENAIQHGITPDRGLTIEVLGYAGGDDVICLQVSDDGEGMTSEAQEALMRRLEDDSGEGSIGLRNVHRRLRLRYGSAYGVSIRSIPHQSTVVTLTLPKEYRKEDV